MAWRWTAALGLCALACSCAGQATAAPGGADDRAAVTAMARKLAWFARHPQEITVARVERAFPGKYTIYQCGNDHRFCSRENKDQRTPIRLNTYAILVTAKGRPGGGEMTVFTSPSRSCLLKEALDGILGVPGERPRVAPLMEQFPPPQTTVGYFEYRKLNPDYPDVHIDANFSDDCLVMLALYALVDG